MSVKGLACAGVLCVLFCAPGAPALAGRGHFPDGSPSAKAAKAIAVKYWRQDPCDGDVAIGWSPMAWDTYANSSWETTSPGERMVNCRIEFNSRVTFSWSRFCTIMVHEYGHLTGLDHSKDPDSVMFPRPKPFPGCVAAAVRRARASSASRR